MADPAGFIHVTAVGPNLYASEHIPHDNDMPDATPSRKMYSSILVNDQQYTDDNRGTGMQDVKALAKARKVSTLKKVVPNTPRP